MGVLNSALHCWWDMTEISLANHGLLLHCTDQIIECSFQCHIERLHVIRQPQLVFCTEHHLVCMIVRMLKQCATMYKTGITLAISLTSMEYSNTNQKVPLSRPLLLDSRVTLYCQWYRHARTLRCVVHEWVCDISFTILGPFHYKLIVSLKLPFRCLMTSWVWTRVDYCSFSSWQTLFVLLVWMIQACSIGRCAADDTSGISFTILVCCTVLIKSLNVSFNATWHMSVFLSIRLSLFGFCLDER